MANVAKHFVKFLYIFHLSAKFTLGISTANLSKKNKLRYKFHAGLSELLFSKRSNVISADLCSNIIFGFWTVDIYSTIHFVCCLKQGFSKSWGASPRGARVQGGACCIQKCEKLM